MTRILLVVVQDKSANLKARRTDLSPTLSLYKQFGSSPGADTCSFPSTPPSLPPPIWHVSPRVSALRGSGHHRPSKNALELETHANSKLSFAWYLNKNTCKAVCELATWAFQRPTLGPHSAGWCPVSILLYIPPELPTCLTLAWISCPWHQQKGGLIKAAAASWAPQQGRSSACKFGHLFKL